MSILQNTIQRLNYLLEIIPPLLNILDDETFSSQQLPGKWSKKQIIGHLIDSATNNHHRMVRAQFDDTPSISYDQNKWNEFGHYQHIPKDQIIHFWEVYNRQLLALIPLIPNEKLENKIEIKGEKITLRFIIEDYVVHMEHHLRQVVNY
jgi:hypothetical protein